MTLDEFSAKEQKRIQDFVAHWYQNKRETPEQFPDDLDEGEWDEQFFRLVQPTTKNKQRSKMTSEQNLQTKANHTINTLENFLNVPSKEKIEHVLNAMLEYQTAWVTVKASKIRESI